MSEQPYTVVVGVSATSTSPTALTWGEAQARQSGGRLVAVRAWRMPNPQATPSGTTATRIPRQADTEQAARAQLEADVAAVLGPDHDAEVRLVRGGKRRVLLSAAEEADLLVIDAPGAFRQAPMFAQRLVYAASCPVVVMPPRISGVPPSGARRAGRALADSALRSAGTAGRPGYRPPLRPSR